MSLRPTMRDLLGAAFLGMVMLAIGTTVYVVGTVGRDAFLGFLRMLTMAVGS